MTSPYFTREQIKAEIDRLDLFYKTDRQLFNMEDKIRKMNNKDKDRIAGLCEQLKTTEKTK